jgi:hypothetical protein
MTDRRSFLRGSSVLLGSAALGHVLAAFAASPRKPRAASTVDRWIIKKLGPAKPRELLDLVGDRDLVELLGVAGDPNVIADARTALADRRKYGPVVTSAAMRIAANADRDTTISLLPELDAWSAYQAVATRATAASRYVREAIAANTSLVRNLPAPTKLALLTARCDVKQRIELLRLATLIDVDRRDVTTALDECARDIAAFDASVAALLKQ